MVAIEHCQISTVAGTIVTTTTTTTTTTPTPTNSNSNNNLITGAPSDILSPITPTSPTSSSTTISSTTTTSVTNVQEKLITSTSLTMSSKAPATFSNNNSDNEDNDVHKEATNTRKTLKTNESNTNEKSTTSECNAVDNVVLKTPQELSKKILKLDLKTQPSLEIDENSLKSPKSPIAARLSHQTSLASSVDIEDRKTLREALYQGIFSRHRRTIFAFGSFLRMLRSRTGQPYASPYNTIRSSSEGEDVDNSR